MDKTSKSVLLIVLFKEKVKLNIFDISSFHSGGILYQYIINLSTSHEEILIPLTFAVEY
jgi:hypothetical protein